MRVSLGGTAPPLNALGIGTRLDERHLAVDAVDGAPELPGAGLAEGDHGAEYVASAFEASRPDRWSRKRNRGLLGLRGNAKPRRPIELDWRVKCS